MAQPLNLAVPLVNLKEYLVEISRPRPKVTAGYIFFADDARCPEARVTSGSCRPYSPRPRNERPQSDPLSVVAEGSPVGDRRYNRLG